MQAVRTSIASAGKALAVLFALAGPAAAQPFNQTTDPRPILGQLIGAFQNCGPSNVYLMLGTQLYQTIYQQTNGMGCYDSIRSAGAVTGMQVTGSQLLPAGPVFSVRVFHALLAVDWFIGLSNLSGKVEYLYFQAANNRSAPNVATGPTAQPSQSAPVFSPPPTQSTPSYTPPAPAGQPSAAPNGSPQTTAGASTTASSGCTLYPAMCQ